MTQSSVLPSVFGWWNGEGLGGGQVEAERAEQDCIKDKTLTDGNGVLSSKFVRSLKLSHFLRLKKKKEYCYISIMLYCELKYHFFKNLVLF